MDFASNKGIAIASTPVIIGLVCLFWTETGQVIDGATGKPLAGVHVVARWDGQGFAGVVSKHTCFKVEAAQTDEKGRFSLSPFSWNFNPLLSDRRRTLIFYKRGFKAPELTAEPNDSLVTMTTDERTGVERLKYIGGAAGGANCGTLEQQRRALLPIYQAVYEESKGIAADPEDLRWVNSALYSLELLTVGDEAASQNFSNRAKSWGVQ